MATLVLGPFDDGKSGFFSLKSGIGISYSIGPKVSPNLGFGIGIRPKLKSWFRSQGDLAETFSMQEVTLVCTSEMVDFKTLSFPV